MRVLYVFQSDFTGPGEKLFFYQANELARSGHESLVLVNGDPETIRIMSQPAAFEYCRLEFQGTRLGARVLDRIVRFGPDVVHAQYIRNEPFRAALEVKRRLRIPLVVHHDDAEEVIFGLRFSRWWESPLSWGRIVAGTWLHPGWWHWYNPLLKSEEAQIDAHDCLTTALKADLRQRLDWEAEHLLLGIDLDYFNLPPEPDKRRLPPGLSPEEFVLMYNGALHRYTLRDFEMLLDAVALARQRAPGLRLVFSGSNFKSKRVHAAIQRRRLDGCVTGLGLVPTMEELKEHFAYADVFVQPGHNTRFNELRLPSKVMFYLAAGRPTITPAFGFGRMLEHRKDAYLFHDYQAGAIAEAILELRAHAPLRAEISRNAQVTARRLFDVRRTTPAFLALYRNAASGRRPDRIPVKP